MLRNDTDRIKSHTFLDYISVLQISDGPSEIDCLPLLESTVHTCFAIKKIESIAEFSLVNEENDFDICLFVEPQNNTEEFSTQVFKAVEQAGDRLALVVLTQTEDSEFIPTRCHVVLDRIPIKAVNKNNLARALFNSVRVKKCELASLDALAEQTLFFSRMSHELRTPMNSIMGFSQILEKSATELNKRQLSCVEAINRNSEGLLALINDLLDLTREKAIKVNTFPSKFDVDDLLEETTNKMIVLAQNYQLSLDVEKLPETILMISDWQRLSQVLINLVSNALKYTEKGGVTLSANLLEEEIQFFVKDTGVGIAQENIEEIFDEYTTLNPVMGKQVESTGIGLPLAKSIAESLGGKIEVESEVGAGSTFVFTTPRIIRSEIYSRIQ